MSEKPRTTWLKVIGPGILVAATGVGAGDLATGAFSGNALGVAVLWAVLVGAFLKFVLTEGLTRWQLATGDTLLEGCVTHFGILVQIVFILYLVLWSFFVGTALLSACGVTANAMLPMSGDPATGKIVYGILHGLAAAALVWWGGYRLFEKAMSVCIAIMFVTVVVTSVQLVSDWQAVIKGLVWPTIPELASEGLELTGEGLDWTIALIGGVGGTVTILCYGYWIREEGRFGGEFLKTCRIDLATGYVMTAIFGIGMVIIGSTIEVDAKGVQLIVSIADQLQDRLGAAGRWAFLIGGWGAVTSSLLGYCQSIPYLYTDYTGMMLAKYGGRERQPVSTQSTIYRATLMILATVPMVGLWVSFREVQKLYAIIGAAFMPLLAAALLFLNGSRRLVGEDHRNKPWTTVILYLTLIFFLVAGGLHVYKTTKAQRHGEKKQASENRNETTSSNGSQTPVWEPNSAKLRFASPDLCLVSFRVHQQPAKQSFVNVRSEAGASERGEVRGKT